MKDFSLMKEKELEALARVIVLQETEAQSDRFFVETGVDILNNLFCYGKQTGKKIEDIPEKLTRLLADEGTAVMDLNKVIDFDSIMKRVNEKTRFACYVVTKVALENFIKKGAVA